MTNRDVALLAFKMLGFLLIVTAAIPIAAYLVWGGVQGESTATTLAPALFFLIIGVPVWFGAGLLAAHIFPTTTANAARDPLRGDALFALAVSVIGTLLVCMALPDIARALTLFRESRNAVLEADQHVWNPIAKAHAVAAVVRLLTGIALLIGRARLGSFVTYLYQELRGPDLSAGEAQGRGPGVKDDAVEADAAGEAQRSLGSASKPRN